MKDTTIRKWATIAAAVVCCLGLSSQAGATTILDTSSSLYLGFVSNPEPSSPTDEAGYINNLVDLAPSTSTTIDSRDYDRSANTLCYNTCPDATATGAVTDNSGDGTGDFGSGFTYLLGKYDGPNDGDLIWYVAGLTGDFSIPLTDNGYGLSHWALFNPGGGDGGGGDTVVPEPASLALFGIGTLVAVRRFRKRLA